MLRHSLNITLWLTKVFENLPWKICPHTLLRTLYKTFWSFVIIVTGHENDENADFYARLEYSRLQKFTQCIRYIKAFQAEHLSRYLANEINEGREGRSYVRKNVKLHKSPQCNHGCNGKIWIESENDHVYTSLKAFSELQIYTWYKISTRDVLLPWTYN